MEKNIGIWLDHRKAIVVLYSKAKTSTDVEKTEIVEILSDVERKVRLSGGARTGKTPWGPQDIAVDSKIEDRQQHQLKLYFEEIVKKIKSADKLLIMGPGEAKIEFKKHLQKSKKLAEKLTGTETCDKMTDKQIAAKVRAFFNDNR